MRTPGTLEGDTARRVTSGVVEVFSSPQNTDPNLRFTAYDVYFTTDGAYAVVDRSRYVESPHD